MLIKYANYLSLNVLLATCICSVSFFKLPDGNGTIHIIPLTQIILGAWAVYILDRILDNQKVSKPNTLRHEFYQKNQFNLSLLLLCIIIVNITLLFFEEFNIIILGLFISAGVFCYLYFINKAEKAAFYKELIMPALYVLAVVGVPFVSHDSINLSSWILAFIFLILVVQNLLTFSIFESIINSANENICFLHGVRKVRKWLFSLSSLIIVIVVLLFTSENTYGSKLALMFMTISLIMSYSVTKPQYFIENERYRWIIDGLLLFPIFIF